MSGLLATAAGCTPEPERAAARAIITGNVVLADIAGLNDMSRVRVDIGRGEGGVVPSENGSFYFDDLEPDEYALSVTYQGGLDPSASRSAYLSYKKPVLALEGGSVHVGEVVLALATATVQGEVRTSDGRDVDDAEVLLIDAEGIVRRTQALQGEYMFERVPVGHHRLEVHKSGYTSAQSQTVCRPPVAIGEGGITITPEPVILAQTTPTFAAGFGEVSASSGTTWYVVQDRLTLRVLSGYATEGRVWQNEEPAPAWSPFRPDGYLLEELAAGQSTVHVQLRNHCGFESETFQLTVVRDDEAPRITRVFSPTARLDEDGTAWLVENAAVVDVVVEATDDTSSISGLAVYHPQDTEHTEPANLVFRDFSSEGNYASQLLSVQLSEGQGEKSVVVYAKDRAGNVSEPAHFRFVVDTLPPTIHEFGLLGGRSATAEPIALFQVRASDAGGLAFVQTSRTGAFVANNQPYAETVAIALTPPEDDGHRTVYMRVWDVAGNTATASAEVELRVKGILAGAVTREDADEQANAGIEVIAIGVGHQASTYTNDLGGYELRELPPGRYRLEFRATGYRVGQIDEVVISSGAVAIAPYTELARRKGSLRGVVTAEDGIVPRGAKVSLLDTPHQTTVDETGVYSLDVPVGTYAGLKVSYPHYEDSVYRGNLTVTEEGTFVVPPLNLRGWSGILRGAVTLTGKPTGAHEGIEVMLEGQAGSATFGWQVRALTDPNGLFEFNNRDGYSVLAMPANTSADELPEFGLPVGHYEATLTPPETARTAGREQIRHLEVLIRPGDENVLTAELRDLFVRVNEGEAVVTNPLVDLSFGATGCRTVQVALGAPPQTDAAQSPCNAVLRHFCLGAVQDGACVPSSQGTQTVYVRFQDEEGLSFAETSTQVWLDSVAAIESIELSRAGQPYSAELQTTPLRYGELLTMTVRTGENGGTVRADIDGYATGITFEEQGAGCLPAETGCYGTEYRLLRRQDIVPANGSPNLHIRFVDMFGNESTADGPSLHIGIRPRILELSIEPILDLAQAHVSFRTDEWSRGQVLIGGNASSMCTPPHELNGEPGATQEDVCPPATEGHEHAATLTGRHAGEATVHLERDTPYFVQVYATDAQGNTSYSSIQTFFLRPDPPLHVVAMPGIQRVHLRWEAPEQEQLAGYLVERSTDNGESWQVLAGGGCTSTSPRAYQHEALLYTDESVEAFVGYRYRVKALDTYCNPSAGTESQEAIPVATASSSGTVVAQGMLEDFVWTEAGSPYFIEGSIGVPTGEILVVGPNTRVHLAGDSRILVQGQIATYGGRGSEFSVEANGFPLENDHDAVIFETSSFWPGIDLQNSETTRTILSPRGYRAGTLLYRTFLRGCEPCVQGNGYPQLMRAYSEGSVSSAAFRGILFGTSSIEFPVSSLGSDSLELIDVSEQPGPRRGHTRTGFRSMGYYDESNICPDLPTGCPAFRGSILRSKIRGWPVGSAYDSDVHLPFGGQIFSARFEPTRLTIDLLGRVSTCPPGMPCGYFSSRLSGPFDVRFGRLGADTDGYKNILAPTEIVGSILPGRTTIMADSASSPVPSVSLHQVRQDTATCAISTSLRAGFENGGAARVAGYFNDCHEQSSAQAERIFDVYDDVSLGELVIQPQRSSTPPQVWVDGPTRVQQAALRAPIVLQIRGYDAEEGPLTTGKWRNATGLVVGDDAEPGRLTLPSDLEVGHHLFWASVSDQDGQVTEIPWNVDVRDDLLWADHYRFPDAERWRVAALQLLELPAKHQAPNAATFRWQCSTEGCRVQCSLDEEPPLPCRSPMEVAGLAAGPHTLTFHVQDASGALADLPQTYGWEVAAPDVLRGRTSIPTMRLQAGPSEDEQTVSLPVPSAGGQVWTCSFDGRPEAPCTETLPIPGVLPGGETPQELVVRVRAAEDGALLAPARTLRLHDEEDPDGDGWLAGDPCASGAERGEACSDPDQDGLIGAADPTPVGATWVSDWVQLSVGGAHSCAIGEDKTIQCWGRDHLQQLDSPPGTYRAVSVGLSHTCAIRTDDTVVCWPETWETTPPPGRFQSISAGGFHTCALRLDGTPLCWGRNGDGQLDAPEGIYTSVSAGLNHSCGVRTNGTVECWGEEADGQSAVPEGTFASVRAGERHSCGVRTNGTVECWGKNTNGMSTPPTGIFVTIDTGYKQTCGLRPNGQVECWGAISSPLGRFVAVGTGRFHACALRQDGLITCWGNDSYGQLGERPLHLPPAWRVPTLTSVTATRTKAENGERYVWLQIEDALVTEVSETGFRVQDIAGGESLWVARDPLLGLSPGDVIPLQVVELGSVDGLPTVVSAEVLLNENEVP